MAATVDRLVAQARRGDRVALGRLLLLHDQRLRDRISRRIAADVRGVLSADDVLQDTYAEVYRHIRRFEPSGPRSFFAWLATIADRKLLDSVKGQRAAKRSPPAGAKRVTLDRSTSLLGLVRLVDKKSKTPSRVISRQEAIQALQVALASLPEPCRQVVWMRHIEGKAAREIAVVLGRSEGAVNQLCHRGLQRLRELMGSRSDFLSDSE